MNFRRHPLALVTVAVPWLLATVGMTLRACPDHGDAVHGAAHASHASPSHTHGAGMPMADRAADASTTTPAQSPQTHQCNCPGAACCTAAVAVVSAVVIDAPSRAVVPIAVGAFAPLSWATSGHDTRLPFANGPPLSAF